VVFCPRALIFCRQPRRVVRPTSLGVRGGSIAGDRSLTSPTVVQHLTRRAAALLP